MVLVKTKIEKEDTEQVLNVCHTSVVRLQQTHSVFIIFSLLHFYEHDINTRSLHFNI